MNARTAPRWCVLNWGLGVDSTAILLRIFQYLAHWERQGLTPAERDVALGLLLDLPGVTLERSVVIVAMTGSESPITGQLAQAYILPRLSRWGIRLVQIARAGPYQEDGVTILDDSRHPTELHMAGDFTLFTEMVRAGTIPQLGGERRCSMKAKGVPGDETIATVTRGERYWQIMGYELDEKKRCTKDTASNDDRRTGVYPLATSWGWTREICERFIHQQLGVWWPKSACTFCVFALSNKAGRARVLAMFAHDPELAYEALVMEQISVALNPTQTLLRDGTLYDLMATTPGQRPALELFEQRLNAMPWALVEVRRAMDAKNRDPHKRGTSARDLLIHSTGSRADIDAALSNAADLRGEAIDRTDGRYPRVWIRRRQTLYPTTEHLLTIAPALVVNKTAPAFPKLWFRITGDDDSGQLSIFDEQPD